MKKKPYTFKNAMPKAWKKKKRTQEPLKKQKLGINRDEQLLSKATSYFGKKRPHYLKGSQSKWKLPSILLISSLIIIILIVPTLIVIPYVNNDENVTTSVEVHSNAVVEPSASSFTVAVMRNESEEIEGVPLETYVARVVASEMPASFEKEALKAQSLAARTYIINHLLHQSNSEQYDVTDTTQHQVYKNEDELRKLFGSDFNWKMDKLKEAVSATQGEILTYNDAPITPAFFSTSNGYTENSEDYWENELPYLRSVKSPWDKDSPKFLDQQIFTISDVQNALKIELPNIMPIAIEVTRTESERVSQLKLADKTFSGRDVREKLQLQSSDFSIEQKNNHLIFRTKGYGHGIGMSQYGANGMAKEGKGYEDIVKYYYQDVEVSTITETAPTLVAK